MKKRYWVTGIIAIVLLGIFYYAASDNESEDEAIVVKSKRGDFVVEITTSGELEARNSVEIMGPGGMRSAGIWRVEIRDMIDEGTLVEKGDYVARLDQSELLERVQSEEIDLQQSTAEFTQAKLDTALELRQARDELINLKFAVEEKEIILSQSQYEPPATIKQAEIDVEKANRTYNQAQENYKLMVERAEARMAEAYAEVSEDQNNLNRLTRLLDQFTIYAPESGMLIYLRDRNGQKRGVGSMIEAWRPTVATLPDLSRMNSRTYVNEVDIRSVRVGQPVKIGLDAYPDKELSGQIISVANIGEQRPNSDAKVFMVNVEVNEADTTLRPSMTTSNKILAEKVENVVFVPLECLHSQGDSLTYVVVKEGLSVRRQQVRVGKTNANEAIIEEGINEGLDLFLSVPKGMEDSPLTTIESAQPNVATTDN